jgi:hypothetical protein
MAMRSSRTVMKTDNAGTIALVGIVAKHDASGLYHERFEVICGQVPEASLQLRG